MWFTGTYNSVRQKQAADHLSRASTPDGVVRSRSWLVSPHPTTMKPRLSKRRVCGMEGKLTEQSHSSYRRDNAHNSLPIVDMVHPINLRAVGDVK